MPPKNRKYTFGGNMRYRLAVFAGKLTILILKMLGRKASTNPGVVAMKICPDVLKIMAKKLNGDIIAVLGTNGKTTTNNMLTDYLEAGGKKTVSNRVGANMKTGVATAFLNKANWFGKLNADVATLEMDEAWAKHIFPEIMPTKVVLNNLFRDQLDRYGDIESTMGHLKKAIACVPDATLIANGDDPLIFETVRNFPNKKHFYGIKDKFLNTNEGVKEGKYCYACGEKLKYNFIHFSQLGDYYCDCGFKRPELTYSATDISVFPTISFSVDGFGEINLNGRGVYNIYNVLGAMAGAVECGVPFEIISTCAKKYTPQIGRMEHFSINGKDVYLVLAKNPAGFDQSVNTVLEDPRQKDVILAVNDAVEDGQDVSWLWDVNFDAFLEDKSILSYTVSGVRYGDLALRLKYSGVDEKEISLFAEIKNAIDHALDGKGETLYLLVNYTVLFSAQAYLKEKEQ